jgi:hypothetical protein
MLVALFLIGGSARAGGLDSSVVLVTASKQPPSIESPWEFQALKTVQCLGTVVDGGYILVTAFVVIDAKLIEMKRIGQSKIDQLKVKFIDPESNLALLELVEKSAGKKLEPLDLGDKLPLGSGANLYSAPKGGKFILHQAYLSSVSSAKVPTSSMEMLYYQFKIQEKGLGWGEPILSDGKLVGLTAGQNDEYALNTFSSIALMTNIVASRPSDLRHLRSARATFEPCSKATRFKVASASLASMKRVHLQKSLKKTILWCPLGTRKSTAMG